MDERWERDLAAAQAWLGEAREKRRWAVPRWMANRWADIPGSWGEGGRRRLAELSTEAHARVFEDWARSVLALRRRGGDKGEMGRLSAAHGFAGELYDGVGPIDWFERGRATALAWNARMDYAPRRGLPSLQELGEMVVWAYEVERKICGGGGGAATALALRFGRLRCELDRRQLGIVCPRASAKGSLRI